MLEKIVKPEIDTVELKSDGKYGKFVLSPLERQTSIALLTAGCGSKFCQDRRSAS